MCCAAHCYMNRYQKRRAEANRSEEHLHTPPGDRIVISVIEMYRLREQMQWLREKALDVVAAEETWTECLVETRYPNDFPVEQEKLKTAVMKMAKEEVFRIYPGGVHNPKYVVRHAEHRIACITFYVSDSIDNPKAYELREGRPTLERKPERLLNRRLNNAYKVLGAQIESSQQYLREVDKYLKTIRFSDSQKRALKIIEEAEIRHSEEYLAIEDLRTNWSEEVANYLSWKPIASKGQPRKGQKAKRKTRKQKNKIKIELEAWGELSGSAQDLIQIFQLQEIEEVLKRIFDWKGETLFPTPFPQISEDELRRLEPAVDSEDEVIIVSAPYLRKQANNA